jgi:Organic solute transporter Ostalpha
MEPQPLSARRTLSLSRQAGPVATAATTGSTAAPKPSLKTASARRVPSIKLTVGDQTIELTDAAANSLPGAAGASDVISQPSPPPGIVFSGGSSDDSSTLSSSTKDSSRILGKRSYLAPVPELTTPATVDESLSSARSPVASVKGTTGATAKPKKSRWVCVSEILLYMTFIAIVAIGGVLVFNFLEKEEDRMTMILSVAGTFACTTCALSLHDTHLHVKFYMNSLQRLYIRILFMCIIYAFCSWMALRYLQYRIYFEVVREWYESILLYGFFQLMIQFLGGKKKLAQRLKETGKAYAKHAPGCCCLRPWRMGSRFVHRTSLGVLQYVMLRFVVSAIALICEATGVYKEGYWTPK